MSEPGSAVTIGRKSASPRKSPPWGEQLVKTQLRRRKRQIGKVTVVAKVTGISRVSHEGVYYLGQSLGGKPWSMQEGPNFGVTHLHGNIVGGYIVSDYKRAVAVVGQVGYGYWPATEPEKELESGEDPQLLALPESGSLPLSMEESEITVVSALKMLLKDTFITMRDQTFSWAALWGGLVQLLARLVGGFDAQVEAVVGLVIFYLTAKALLDLRAGQFGSAAWRIFHFPIWMCLIVLGNLADLSQIPELRPVSRELALTFVGIWCFGGATQGFMQLLGIERVDRFRRDFKRIVRENFFEPEE